MDFGIMRHIKTHYNLAIGEGTAENIKMPIGNAYPDPKNLETIEVKGRDLIWGVPKTITIGADEVREIISEQINAILNIIKATLEQTPPELAGDIVDRGIVLTGGVALLKNLDKLLQEETGLSVTVTEDPLSTVALGSGMVFDSEEVLKQLIVT